VGIIIDRAGIKKLGTGFNTKDKVLKLSKLNPISNCQAKASKVLDFTRLPDNSKANHD